MNIYTLVGKRIRAERIKANLTIEQLSEASSISTSFLAYIERGKKKASLGTVQKIADGLQIPVTKFFANISPTPLSPDNRALKRLMPLLKEKRPADRELILDVLKALAKKLPKR